MGSQAALDAPHTAVVGRVVVIVSQEVQQAVQGENLQLSGIGVPRLARLPPRGHRRDDDIAKESRRARRRPHANSRGLRRGPAEAASR
ncbi:MAG: hypothetical protein DMF84_04535 [Acidobacteria bacterium]|nr:MAG: hypothetical protein DMF84_04535 [Acidobacteriota bacterium]